MVLFHISVSLGATMHFVKARLGADEGCYSVELRVSRPQPENIDPEILGFIKSRNFLSETRMAYRTTQFRGDKAAASETAKQFEKMTVAPAFGDDSSDAESREATEEESKVAE